MSLKYAVAGYTSIIIGVFIDLWEEVRWSGSGIDPRIISFGGLSMPFYVIGILLLCRGMQVAVKESTMSLQS